MDDVDRLMAAFRAPAPAPAATKLDVVMALEGLQDPRIVPFLLRVLTYGREPTGVRVHVVKWLRNRHLAAEFRLGAAHAFLRVLARRSAPELRLESAVALAEFTDIEGVPAALGRVVLDATEPLELRYSAFSSLERAGPTPECIALLGLLRDDDTLGPASRSLLVIWHRAWTVPDRDRKPACQWQRRAHP
jgi:hypothetical protein